VVQQLLNYVGQILCLLWAEDVVTARPKQTSYLLEPK